VRATLLEKVRRGCSTPTAAAGAGTVRFDWDALDWFERQPIVGHPRNPYARVDGCARTATSTSKSTASYSPMPCCGVSLRNRFADKVFIDRTDVVFANLEPVTRSPCAVQASTSGYWSVRVGETVHPDLAVDV